MLKEKKSMIQGYKRNQAEAQQHDGQTRRWPRLEEKHDQSGRTGRMECADDLGWLTLISFLGFLLALLVAFWPRRRIEEK
jgi:hypothetical protein